jgi:hypothetical protein
MTSGRLLIIEAEMLVERSVGGHRAGDQKQRVAVGGRAHDRLDANIGAAARSVLDDERLPQMVRKPLAGQARQDVERAAGRHRHHDAD